MLDGEFFVWTIDPYVDSNKEIESKKNKKCKISEKKNSEDTGKKEISHH